MGFQTRLQNPLFHPFLFIFQIFQWLAAIVLAPNPPAPSSRLGRPRIAIIGAGITGVSSAAHCIGYGFDVVIFEAGTEKKLGGMWSIVNITSSLQIHSAMYRFRPSVQWDRGYPDRQQILDKVRGIWEKYGLDKRTKFETRVERVYKDGQGRWIVNHTANGHFDGIIAAIGACGDPKMPHMEGIESFQKPVHHSSRLTGIDVEGKTMIVVGGGASAVEALEYAFEKGAKKVYILSRSDKWVIPRNPIVDILLALNIWGQEIPRSWIPERLLKTFFYRDPQDIALSSKGIFTDTPMVNSDVMDKLRSGAAEWVRCDIDSFHEGGVFVNKRDKGVPEGGPGKRADIHGDMIVMATGYKRPALDFLPEDSFQPMPPNWYLQTFPPQHPSISAINCTYISAVGTAGNWHIGIYTRILLMFLIDPSTRPSTFWMERWIDMTKALKTFAPTAAFDFFTYLELIWWFTFCVAFNPFRWKWAFFVFFGLSIVLPKRVVEEEEQTRNGLGMHQDADNPDVGHSF
ncbi:hypothetical protein ONZ43_g3657 [Nemania bipapillata]|uniref:Uncharacterized protein n=1 Tax=Nemania bipapillata TaxID=110536 RepID=A0ACC2IW30_9PEZI|nr:hypothetical protein ONZ43_g3657 [Nemania bipapillata]